MSEGRIPSFDDSASAASVASQRMGKDSEEKHFFDREPCLAAVLIALAYSFLLGLYAPLELYFTNIEEFRFDFSALCPKLLLLFVVIFLSVLLGFAFCYLLHRRLFQLFLALSLIGYLCTYIQGMFLVGNLPPLDGTTINWGDYRTQMIASIILWIIVLSAAMLFVRRFGREKLYPLASGVSAFFTAVLLFTLITVCLMNNGLKAKPSAIATTADEFTMSSDQNLVVFIIDAVDASAFTELLETKEPELQGTLQDFTYFPNTVGSYPFTRKAIPFILTGQWDENSEPFFEYTTRAYDASPLLHTLRAQGYRIGIYEEEIDYKSDRIYEFENVSNSAFRFTGTFALLKQEIKLIWYKYAPFPLKRLANVDMQQFNNLLVLRDGSKTFSPNNAEFYADVKNIPIETVDERCFRFIHIEGAHVPFRYDSAVNIIPEETGSYMMNLECSMTIFREYLQKLKNAGVYDNTAIIVMGDHGYGYHRDVQILGRLNPLLAVKGIDEHHEMQISQAPISYEDLQTAYVRLLCGTQSDAVFDAKPGDKRSRRCILFFYQQEEHMLEYTQTGHASDINTMVPTGVEYNAHRGAVPSPMD